MRYSIFSAGACLLACANAHFDLVYPAPRGKNTNEMTKGPCGAFSSPSDNRTEVSLDDHAVSVALNLHHDETVLEVLMGVGNDVGDAFNFKLIPSFKMEGMGDFCIPKVDLEAKGIKVENGTNATLQVISNGDPTGGLYSCADITFKKSVSFSKYDSCKNNTGFKEVALEGSAAQLNANETTADGTAQSGDDDDDDANESGATSIAGASWVVLGAAIAGALALL